MTQIKNAGGGLAGLAKKVEPKKSSSKEIPAVEVKGLAEQLTRRMELVELMATNEAELKMLDGILKPIGKEQFIRLYAEQKMRPDTFKLVTDGTGQVMVIVMDKYLKVDATKAEMLKDYPEVLDTKKVYTLNAEIAERNGDAIAQAIMSSKKISDEDKANLLEVTEEQFIKKGTIERMLQFKNWQNLFNLIEPIVQFKNCR